MAKDELQQTMLKTMADREHGLARRLASAVLRVLLDADHPPKTPGAADEVRPSDLLDLLVADVRSLGYLLADRFGTDTAMRILREEHKRNRAIYRQLAQGGAPYHLHLPGWVEDAPPAAEG